MQLLHGYLGFGNYGDELLAKLVTHALKQDKPDEEIDRLSAKNSWLEHFSKISDCKEMICIGGLFQDKSSPRTPVYYFLTILFAKLMGKRVKILAQGIGPLNRWQSSLMTFLAFKLADKVSVRDQNSHLMLKDWGVDHYYGSDLAWLLAEDSTIKEYDPETSKPISKILPAQSKEKISKYFFGLAGDGSQKVPVISIRNEADDHSGEFAIRLVDKIAKELDINENSSIVILQMQDQDRKIHDLFYRYTKKIYLVEASYFSPEEIVHILRTYGSSMIAMRFHALVFAKIAGLDNITAIASDPKIREFTHQVDVYTTEDLRDRAHKHFEKVLF